jgi:hydroxymethylpyrimidine/phosphomethylpyrimidine kinase
MTKTSLTIAGSDSGGEAGIQADLKTFNDFGVFGLSCITATTAQNPHGITSINPVTKDCLQDQLDAVKNYFKPEFIKTGLIKGQDQIKVLIDSLFSEFVVTDPVIISSSGTPFLELKDLDLYNIFLSKKVSLLTPNWPELEYLLAHPFRTESEIKNTLIQARAKYNLDIYLKGGHSNNPNIDYLISDSGIYKLTSPLIKNTHSTHGTGCRLSSAICASLALNETLLQSACLAKNYVYHCINGNSKIAQERYVMNSPGPAKQLEMVVDLEKLDI